MHFSSVIFLLWAKLSQYLLDQFSRSFHQTEGICVKSPVWHKIGCHGNVPRGIGKTGPDQENSRKYLPVDEKIVKIGPVDTEIALLIVKNKEKKKKLTQANIPYGKFAELAKNGAKLPTPMHLSLW